MKYGVPIFAFIFDFMTLKEGGGVLFFDGVARREAGAYVPFVLWFNFLTGFALIATGAGILIRKPWVGRLTAMVAVLSSLVLIAFLIFVAVGGAHENRTLVAMPLRTVIWVGIAYWTRLKLPFLFGEKI